MMRRPIDLFVRIPVACVAAGFSLCAVRTTVCAQGVAQTQTQTIDEQGADLASFMDQRLQALMSRTRRDTVYVFPMVVTVESSPKPRPPLYTLSIPVPPTH